MFSKYFPSLFDSGKRIKRIVKEKSLKAIDFLLTGIRWKKIVFWDVNSMYPSTFKDNFPCGIGYDWKPHGIEMRKKLLSPTRVSLVSLQWLDFMSEDIRFRNVAGGFFPIQNAWNFGEKQVGNYRLDGFCVVGETTYILEFNGCHYHGCISCGEPETAEMKQVREKIFFNLNYIFF